MKSILFLILISFLTQIPLRLSAQDHTEHASMPGMDHEDHQMADSEMFQMEQGSGTGMNPQSVPMSMMKWPKDGWNLMFHGTIFAADIQQSAPRGEDRF